MTNTDKPAEQSDLNSNSENTREDSIQILVGPGRTPTSKNALVHGLYASDIVLPWESDDEFQTLFRDLKKEWLPIGRQEMETVLSLARVNFLKHRLMRSTQIVFRSDPFAVEAERAGAKSWSDISALMEKHATEQDVFLQDIKSVSQALKTEMNTVMSAMTAVDKDSGEIRRSVEKMLVDFKLLYQKLHDRLKEKNPDVSDPNHRKAYIDRPRTLAEQAYHPEYIEKLIKLEASIDTRIDKLLQRLVTLQEYRTALLNAPLDLIVHLSYQSFDLQDQ